MNNPSSKDSAKNPETHAPPTPGYPLTPGTVDIQSSPSSPEENHIQQNLTYETQPTSRPEIDLPQPGKTVKSTPKKPGKQTKNTSDIALGESISPLHGWKYQFRKTLFAAWIIILCFIIAIIVTFIVQNSQIVRVSFLTWHGEAPLAIALLIALIGGATFMFVILSWKLWGLRQLFRKSSHKQK